MRAELLAWGFIAAVYVAAFGVLQLPKHWYRFAQVIFGVATILADAKIIDWAVTSSHLKLRAILSPLGLLATTCFAVWFIRKVQKDIREEKAGSLSGVTTDYQRTLIDNWRRMVVVAERKYKSGKEPDVSFAEIFERQPEYVSLSPWLSADALDALRKDKFDDTVRIVMSKNRGKKFINPHDALKLILAREIGRIERQWRLVPGLLQEEEKHSGLSDVQKTRARLGELLARGRKLYEEDINIGWPRDVAIQLVGWADEVEGVLRQWKGDDSYVELFHPQRTNERVLDINSFPEETPEAVATYERAHSFSVSDLTNGVESHLRSSNSPLRPPLRLFMNSRLSSLEDFIREIK